ncbi:MAG: cbb3-type cytochrome c oxidase subunit 3 [Paraglaciecola sp.]|uniref:cbb3-type cytochrome oxidase subunit 3 n=1 Tax=Pseudomonadati TaxID=3379134 RepID=UPI0027401D0D|nr:CcoQ/FixQ family Cbb3-type cytochrome c oxidase assembly chaperone [Paraglaciecola sp.]MDP5029446.1 cbb3-type cytochrome c oxidase subunit 3 [Paraglaciecola sp.]MDP5133033.1 cbb3-type cytochrome c oxidase subunit 3 [Paraglaciecola sp.]
MDYAVSGSIFTVLVFVCFIGIVLWAFSKKSKKRFKEAENLIFDDEPRTNKQESKLDE